MNISEKKTMNKQQQSAAVAKLASGEYIDYAKQFLLPIDATGPLRVTPSNYPSQVCSRHIHQVVDVSSATLAYANGFTVLMNPNLFAPGFISSALAANITPAIPDLIAVRGTLVSSPNDSTVLLTVAKVTEPDGKEKFIQLKNITDSAALTLAGFNLAPALMTLRGEYVNKCSIPHTLYIATKVAGGAFVTIGPYQTGPDESVTFNAVLPANTDAIVFRLGGAVGGKSFGDINFTLGSSQLLSDNIQTFAPAFDRFVLDNDVSSGRVVSMSVLATNTSPELANGGTVNAGRVPRSFNPANLVASQLSALPSNRRYQGSAKDGAYVSWMPSQFDEFEIDSVANKRAELSDSEYLIVNVAGWNPPAGTTASFRIQFDWIVEFYTPNQLFEKVITPAMTPAFTSLFHALLSMDAATCNPGHLDLLKKMLGKGVMVGKKGMKFYGEHQVIIDSILSKLAMVLAAAL